MYPLGHDLLTHFPFSTVKCILHPEFFSASVCSSRESWESGILLVQIPFSRVKPFMHSLMTHLPSMSLNPDGHDLTTHLPFSKTSPAEQTIWKHPFSLSMKPVGHETLWHFPLVRAKCFGHSVTLISKQSFPTI